MKPIQIISPGIKRLNELSQIMARSNKAAREASNKIVGKRKYRLFRASLRGETVEGLTKKQVSAIRRIGKRRKTIMLEVEAIRNEVIEIFIPAMYSIANRFAKFHPDHESGDYFGEAAVVAVDVVYGYTNPNIKIITYLRRALVSELTRYVRTHRAYGLNSHSSNYLDLLSQVLQATEALASDGKKVDYHSVRAYIEVACREKKSLQNIDLDDYLPGVMSFICPSSDKVDLNNDKENGNDYTVDVANRIVNDPATVSQAAELELVLMDSITFDERIVLRLKMDGLTNDEVAKQNGLTLKEVQTSLSSAQTKIKKRLKHYNAA